MGKEVAYLWVIHVGSGSLGHTVLLYRVLFPKISWQLAATRSSMFFFFNQYLGVTSIFLWKPLVTFKDGGTWMRFTSLVRFYFLSNYVPLKGH